MNKHVAIFLILIVGASCEKENPCDLLVNGVYQFPEVPEEHNMTKEEVAAYVDLPEDISSCIATEDLIETCLNYPYIGLIEAGSNPQTGLGLVHSQFRGLRELSTRPDRMTSLLKKYKRVEPLGYDPDWEPVEIGAYSLRINHLEIILSQNHNLELLTKEEKIELVKTAREIYDKKKADFENYTLPALAPTAAVLARLMKMDDFQPFMEAYDPSDMDWDVVMWYWSTTYEITELIYSLSAQYLKHLNEQQS